jgi:uncharacterized caspase-like protein
MNRSQIFFRKACRAVAGMLLACGLLHAPAPLAQAFVRPMILAPVVNQFQAIEMRRHQSRTQLYREALEELRKNPAAADVRPCPQGEPRAGEECIRVAAAPEPAQTASLPDAVPATPPQPLAGGVLPSVATPEAQPVRNNAPPSSLPRRKIALLFGNNLYPAPIPPLETPIGDIEAVGKILTERFGYEVRIVRNAAKSDMVHALNRLGTEVSVDDSVVVFYAGHGYLMDDTKMGYWIPVDASVKTAAKWISNSDIAKFLTQIPARQLILISDSCYSGTLTKEQKMQTADGSSVSRDEIARKRSVLAMSSGGDEPVSDEGKGGHSIFAWSLINALKSAGALTPGGSLHRVVKSEVLKEYPQEPQYGAVLSAGHVEGGEYLFEHTLP